MDWLFQLLILLFYKVELQFDEFSNEKKQNSLQILEKNTTQFIRK
jgi:hypothetical protein